VLVVAVVSVLVVVLGGSVVVVVVVVVIGSPVVGGGSPVVLVVTGAPVLVPAAEVSPVLSASAGVPWKQAPSRRRATGQRGVRMARAR
jgi:hypothetical protein